MQTLHITASGHSCGAEISGVNVQALDTPTITALRQAVQVHLAVVLRNAALSATQLLTLGEIFGEPEAQGISVLQMQDPALLAGHLVVSSDMTLQRPTGSLGASAAGWQSDLSYRARPCSIALLHASEIPASARGSIANQYEAYDTLPAELKVHIEGRMLLHDESIDGNGQLRQGFSTVSDPREATGAQHRIVRTHPDTRRKALYLGRRRNAWIIGMPLPQSEELLDRLWAHATQPALSWTHDWRPGDTLIWDNRCVLYRHHGVDGTSPQLMYRMQLRGEMPR